jgi:hypothetical protein
MARRGGKAASRRSRQRRQQRPTQLARPQAGAVPASEGEEAAPQPVIADTGDAFEKADAELRASTPPPGARATSGGRTQTVRARTSDFFAAAGPSRLGERAATEYHYVLRDLRNIGVLLVVLAILLAVSVVLVNVLGIGRVG